MKLTKEQVEIERKKFESNFTLDDMDQYPTGNYKDRNVQSAWLGWLASRESNNEIELPIFTNDEGAIWLCPSEATESLQSQGYTITDGGTK